MASPTEHVVGYLRVSTEEQGEAGAGLAAQEIAIRNEINRRDWRLIELHTDIASGKSRSHRPGLKRALKQVATGTAGTLMVSKLDRLSRSLVDFAQLMADARAGGWNVVALDLGVDLSTPAGEFLANVMASAAQWERRIIGQRTSDALRARQVAGVKLGRPTRVSPTTAALIQQRRSAGDSYRAIATLLNQREIPTPQGATHWRASSVRSVLISHGADL